MVSLDRVGVLHFDLVGLHDATELLRRRRVRIVEQFPERQDPRPEFTQQERRITGEQLVEDVDHPVQQGEQAAAQFLHVPELRLELGKLRFLPPGHPCELRIVVPQAVGLLA